jgi:hypothetical protein
MKFTVQVARKPLTHVPTVVLSAACTDYHHTWQHTVHDTIAVVANIKIFKDGEQMIPQHQPTTLTDQIQNQLYLSARTQRGDKSSSDSNHHKSAYVKLS